jgi:uncharacterized membrane protein YphA (DoxX/SURF4 family)
LKKISDIGRIFYGIAMAGLGFQTIYDHEFPYMLIPPNHSWIQGLALLTYISGAMLLLAGVCIVFEKQTRPVALLLGTALLLIFCFYYIPYEFTATSNYMQPIEWDNAEKELDLSAGAFVIAGSVSKKNKNIVENFLSKLIPLGAIVFSITIITFGIDHFLYAKGVSEYIPSWIPNHMFWTYLAGIALFGAGIAILLKIRIRLFATLLGTMIFIWFIILHVPKVINAPSAYIKDETTSALLALMYSGVAFVIAGNSKKNQMRVDNG